MSPPGRPKGESLSARREGSPLSPPGRPKGESLSAQREGSPVIATPLSPAQRLAWRSGLALWIALIALCLLWELLLAPLRPGGSWLALKALPLLLPLRGLARGNAKSFQWALLLILLYLAEGSVRVFDPAPVAALAWLEIALAVAFFVAAIVYLRPFKRAPRQATRPQAPSA